MKTKIVKVEILYSDLTTKVLKVTNEEFDSLMKWFKDKENNTDFIIESNQTKISKNGICTIKEKKIILGMYGDDNTVYSQ